MSSTPTIHHLATDFARYGLTQQQANNIIDNRFPLRVSGGVTGRPRCIVLHIQDGNTRGSLQWWSIHQASSTVMIQRDGSILRVIDEKHGPWTNGDVSKPTSTGKRVIAWGGNPNIWSLTIEAEGKPNDNMPDAQLDAIEWQVRDWMRKYDIPADLVIRHADLNQSTRYYCPGSYYQQIMSRISSPSDTTTKPPTPQYAEPNIPAWMTPEELAKGIDRRLGTNRAFACRRQYKVLVKTPRYKFADKNSARVGPDHEVGETIMGEFVIEMPGGWWVLTEYGTRIDMSALTPSVAIRS